jgi:hypothetical protein
MIIKGLQIKGLSYRGKQNLESIGKVIHHFDYRYAATIVSGRVTQWSDLGPNNFSMSNSASGTRLYSQTDGFGDNDLAAGVSMKDLRPGLVVR